MTIEPLILMIMLVAALALAIAGGRALMHRLPRSERRIPETDVPDRWREILARNVPLANRLPPDHRERLLRLAAELIRRKHWEGCNGLEMTEEIQVTIAAHACLLTLELDAGFFPKLRTVLVYPTSFVANRGDDHDTWGITEAGPDVLHGESWSAGMVVLAWDQVLNGARDPSDGQNVVLHEFAHQLDQEDGRPDGVPLYGLAGSWDDLLATELARLRDDADRGRRTVLDPYGAEDESEFFAVATETFFERPRAMKRAHAELYAALSSFYRQDPAARIADGDAQEGP
jgi:hypothetical protein